MVLGVVTGAAVVELDQVEAKDRNLLAGLIEPAASAWAELGNSERTAVRNLLSDVEAREHQLSKNVFAAGSNPLANVSPQLDRLFDRIAGVREIFTVDGSVGNFSYQTLRATVENATERLANRDPSLGSNIGDHVSQFATSSSGVYLQRMADHCSRFEAGLTKAREQIFDALRNVME